MRGRRDKESLDSSNFYEGSDTFSILFLHFDHPLPGTWAIAHEQRTCCGWELEFLAVLWHLPNFDQMSPRICSLASSFEEITSNHIPLTCVKYCAKLPTWTRCCELSWAFSLVVEPLSGVSKVLVLTTAFFNFWFSAVSSFTISSWQLLVVYNHLWIQDHVFLLLEFKAQSPRSGSPNELESATLKYIKELTRNARQRNEMAKWVWPSWEEQIKGFRDPDSVPIGLILSLRCQRSLTIGEGLQQVPLTQLVTAVTSLVLLF